MTRHVVGITGASGAGYAVAFLKRLAALPETEIHLVVTRHGAEVLEHETGLNPEALASRLAEAPASARILLHDVEDLSAPPASGSFAFRAMTVVPCSMGSLAEIAAGTSRNLLTRAADVALKERRTLVLVPRETPYGTVHLRNMLSLSEAGAVILPASPGFYDAPRSVEDCQGFIADRILSVLGLPTGRPEWGVP